MTKYSFANAVLSITVFWSINMSCTSTNNCTFGQGGICGCIQNRNLQAKAFSCSIRDWSELQAAISQPQQVQNLEITVYGVPKLRGGILSNYTSLRRLTLHVNNTQTLENGNIFSHLPSSVTTIEVKGIDNWIPSDLLLQNRNIKVIIGAFLSRSCTNCTLQRNYTYREMTEKRIAANDFSYSSEDLRKTEFFYGVHTHCRGHTFKAIGNLTRYIAGCGFFPRCISEQPECFSSEIKSTPIHRCYKIDNDILNVVLAIGPIALILNLLTFVTVFLTKSLRIRASMLLVANMAFSDFLNSLYALCLVIARKVPYVHFLIFMGTFCKLFGFVWLFGQAAMIFTSLMLTVERYLVIIFVMNPGRKLTSRHVLYSIAVSWTFALILASLPFLGLGTYTGNTFCVPVRPIRDRYHSYEMTVFIGFLGILLYSISIFLYIHIFISVRKSNLVRRVKREHTMAKRIALLVFTNMIFYFMPILIAILWVMTDMAKKMTPITKEILTGALPSVLFTLNSLLNPLLYAYRNSAFLHTLKSGIFHLHGGKTSPLTGTANNSDEHSARQKTRYTSTTLVEKKQVRFALQQIKSHKA